MKNGWSFIGLEDAIVYLHMEAEQEGPTGEVDTSTTQLGVFTLLAERI